MGKIEDKIKEELLQEIFSDTTKIYEFIDNRFRLDETASKEIIDLINAFNNDVTKFVKKTPLS